MSHSVIYVLFKSSKKAAPGIEINTVKDHYIYIYTYIQSKKVQGIHTHAHTTNNSTMPYLVLEWGIHLWCRWQRGLQISKKMSDIKYTTQAALLTVSAWHAWICSSSSKMPVLTQSPPDMTNLNLWKFSEKLSKACRCSVCGPPTPASK